MKVAVGIIQNTQGEYLITQRLHHQSFAGFWEFPGGKVESHETVTAALARELEEEIGIHIDQESLIPLRTIEHNYSEYTVVLEVFIVQKYDGTPFGKEGQVHRWIRAEQLSDYTFPQANLSIIHALQKRHLTT